ncbi:MAG: hypothetical protein QXO69_01515 [archaeon]
MNPTVLVPIITGKEHESPMIEKLKRSDKVVLLFVADEKLRDVPTGFAGARIKAAESAMEKIKNALPREIGVKEYIEWGSWSDKVVNIARLEEADAVLLFPSETSELIKPFLRSAGLGFETVEETASEQP